MKSQKRKHARTENFSEERLFHYLNEMQPGILLHQLNAPLLSASASASTSFFITITITITTHHPLVGTNPSPLSQYPN